MLKPDGLNADNMDRIMLLASWAKTLGKEVQSAAASSSGGSSHTEIITAGMGKPVYPVSLQTVSCFLEYWKGIETLATEALQHPEHVKPGAAIDYGEPQGDSEARSIMAGAMSDWYGVTVKPEHVLFTAGGAGALRTVFETLNARFADTPGYRIITPFPHYTLYRDTSLHRLHPVDVMQEPGYRLTAKAVEASIAEAKRLAEKDGGAPRAILICNPSNPLGTMLHPDEWADIASVLREHPDLQIIFDEAYTEMCFSDIPPLLRVAPDLMSRMVIMRSATKGLSAAGERMAILMAFDHKFANELLAKSISLMGHTPRSSQLAYAKTMATLTVEERGQRTAFYRDKVEYVAARLDAMGACMPDPCYRSEATFYVLGDFSDLFGMEIMPDAKRALGNTDHISTDEEMVYDLLFRDHVMVAPLSYFGVSPEKGFIRITASGSESEMKTLMDRLEFRLLEARSRRHALLTQTVREGLEQLRGLDPARHQVLAERFAGIGTPDASCKALKAVNAALKVLGSDIRVAVMASTPEGRASAATTIQKFFRGAEGRQSARHRKAEREIRWKTFVDSMFSEPCEMKSRFLAMPPGDRDKFAPWKSWLEKADSALTISSPAPEPPGSGHSDQ